jgi:hypothetical protein
MPDQKWIEPRAYYQKLLLTMPSGADRTVLTVLYNHIGLENAIAKNPETDPNKPSRPNLLESCERHGTKFSDERQLRLTIVKLRKEGVPVCASSGESGYFLASSLEEYREFRGREYVKKIIDMRETVNAMDAQIKEMFPADYAAYRQQKAVAAGQPLLL